VHAGRYLELGASPTLAATSRVSVSAPVKIGLSLDNYYELNAGTSAQPVYEDHAFGFFSASALATVPLGATTSFGAWNVHGGVEWQVLGETTRALNGGDRSRVIGSIGLGLSY
jgi:hypothetical protein